MIYKKDIIKVHGMTCNSCEIKLEKTIKKIYGVNNVKASYSKQEILVEYDKDKVDIKNIYSLIEKNGYKVFTNLSPRKSKNNTKEDKIKITQLLGIGIVFFAVYVIIKNTIGFNFIPEVNQSMGYGILFLAGLLTSIHCIAMCGGINLSQCINYRESETSNNSILSRLKPSFLYNLGRVTAYTVIGGIAGGLGSVFSFYGAAKGIVAILAGLFMVIMGINMLNIPFMNSMFPWLRRINIPMSKFFANKIHVHGNGYGAFYIGLLNGLMPCGPLQTMQLYALGTGNIFEGAMSMLVFSVGTVPLMFSFGALSTILSNKFTNKLMRLSAVLVIGLGVIMLTRGLSLSGISTAIAVPVSASNVAVINGEYQTVTINLEPNNYQSIIVQKGIPVRFNIKAEEANINGCNNAIIIPKYNIEKSLKAGDNIVEFLPEEVGDVSYSCWMGMIKSNVKVVEDISKVSPEEAEKDASVLYNQPRAGSCCGR